MKDTRDLNRTSKTFVRAKWAGGPGAADPARRSRRGLGDPSVASAAARVSVHFDGIEDVFVGLCRRYEVVVGAVAWLTNSAILSALAEPEHVAIVVQKEDFLRPDAGFATYPGQRRETRALYDSLRPFEAEDFKETHPGQQEFHPDYNGAVQDWLFDNKGTYQQGGEAVRCMGYAGDPAGRATPRMHHKFLVFGHKCRDLVMAPSCVVTGSFNLTHNATRSRENVLVVEDRDICHAYLSEWAQLWGMSEPLDWSCPEPSPERMYVGT